MTRRSKPSGTGITRPARSRFSVSTPLIDAIASLGAYPQIPSGSFDSQPVQALTPGNVVSEVILFGKFGPDLIEHRRHRLLLAYIQGASTRQIGERLQSVRVDQ